MIGICQEAACDYMSEQCGYKGLREVALQRNLGEVTEQIPVQQRTREVRG